MPNGGTGAITCVSCHRVWPDVINRSWVPDEPGGPVVAGRRPDGRGRYIGRGRGNAILCFTCEPASEAEKTKWAADGWGVDDPAQDDFKGGTSP